MERPSIIRTICVGRYYGIIPLQLLYNTLIKSTIELTSKHWPSKLPIAFMFDDHGGWKEAEEAYRKPKRDPVIEPRLGRISHGNDRKIAPLQMADLMAFETRHKCKEWKRGSGIERHT